MVCNKPLHRNDCVEIGEAAIGECTEICHHPEPLPAPVGIMFGCYLIPVVLLMFVGFVKFMDITVRILPCYTNKPKVIKTWETCDAKIFVAKKYDDEDEEAV